MARRSRRDITRLVKLTYLQSVQVTEGDRPPEDFTQVGVNYSGLESAIPVVREDKRPPLEATLRTKFPYLASPERRRENDTGWMIARSWNQVLWDMVAWRLGIRELGLHAFTFAPVSSVVSVPAISPRPIAKVMLRTEETIPPDFLQDQAWIRYYVTFDDGKKWHRINPLGKPTRFEEDGQVVPRIITLDAERPDPDPEARNIEIKEDVFQVRLRIAMFADGNAKDSERKSPILHAYKLMIYPRAGLTGNGPGDI